MKQHTYQPKILAVDDEPKNLRLIEAILLPLGHQLILAPDGETALQLAGSDQPDVMLLDIMMPGLTGLEVLNKLTAEFPEIIVVMITGVNDVKTAVECMKNGAFDYIMKPLEREHFTACVRKALEHRSIYLESQRLRESLMSNTLRKPGAFEHIVSCDQRIMDIWRYIDATAPTRLPILITGETGAGKEVFAKAVHLASGFEGEFVCVNTAGIDDTLLSDTLFGHKKGAFTGADQDREGLIKRAKGGTLFLDEIGDLRPESQVKLLRLLQDGAYYKVGGDIPEYCEARMVAATNADLVALQQEGRFRKDLFYRLQSHQINIPPIKDRKGDIPLLIDHFLELAAEEMGRKKPTVPRELYTLLQNYSFPGNVRELQGMINDAMGRHQGGILSLSSFKDIVHKAKPPAGTGEVPAEAVISIQFPNPLPTSKEADTALVEEALKRADGNKSLAADMLGITRKTLRSKLTR